MSAPYIPATSLGGDLLTGWCGPHLVPFYRGAGSPPEWVSKPYAGSPVWSDGGDERRLDPRRPEVAHRIADILRSKGHEVGHLLPVALGGRQGDVTAEVPCGACAGRGVGGELPAEDSPRDLPCSRCSGTGTIRRTIPAADVSAVLLAASVAGVETGRGVVRGVLFHGDYNIWRDDDGTVEFPPGEQPTALAAGYAYLSPAAPFGVVVPFLRDGREVGS